MFPQNQANEAASDTQARGEDVPKARAGLLPQIDFTYGCSYTDSDNIYTDGGISTCENNPETGEPLGGEDYERRCRGYSTDSIRQLQLSQPLFSMERIRRLQRAGEQREAADKGAALGLRDLVDVLDARADLYVQRIAYVDAFRKLVLDRLNLLSSTGRLGTGSLADTMVLISEIVASLRTESTLPVDEKVLESALNAESDSATT